MGVRYFLIFIALIILACCATAEEIKLEGEAIEHFERIGAWGWIVFVKSVTNGPAEMVGSNVSVYLTSANPEEYPPGVIDPSIAEGDHVVVYGSLDTIEPGDYDVLLVGSKEYHIKPATPKSSI
jgi:hypothetical protein